MRIVKLFGLIAVFEREQIKKIENTSQIRES